MNYDSTALYLSLGNDKELFSMLTAQLPSSNECLIIPPEEFERAEPFLTQGFLAIAHRLLPHLVKRRRWGVSAVVVGDDVPSSLQIDPSQAMRLEYEVSRDSDVLAAAREMGDERHLLNLVQPFYEELITDNLSNYEAFDDLMACFERSEHSWTWHTHYKENYCECCGIFESTGWR